MLRKKLTSNPNKLSRSLVALCLSLTALSTSINAAQPKHVAVAPENINQQKLIKAKEQGIFSHSTMLPVFEPKNRLSNAQDVITMNIPYDGKDGSPLIFVSPNAEQWQLEVVDGRGKIMLNEKNPNSKQLATENISIGQQQFKGKQLSMKGAPSGMLTLSISSIGKNSIKSGSLSKQPRNSKPLISAKTDSPIGFVMFKGDPQFKLYSYLDNNFTTQGSRLNIVAHMIEDLQNSGDRKNLLNQYATHKNISQAKLTVTSPSNKVRTFDLNDNGLNGDKVAGDGLFGARLPTSEIGNYTTQLQISGIRSDGFKFSRTVNNVYPIASSPYQFKGNHAILSFIKTNQAQISIPVSSDRTSRSVYLSAEVWGTNSQGKPQAASWIGGLVSSDNDKQQATLKLNFDTQWISRLNLKAPFSIRSLRLQDADNHVPVAKRKFIPLRLSHSIATKINQDNLSNLKSRSTLAITDAMRMSNAPDFSNINAKAANNPKLLLVHGYCSSSVWNTGNFSNSVEFQDFDKNRSHEGFAQQILSFGNAYSSYGIVAHSQGGAAALHLYSRYWSGLDYASGGRIIQSVGTPYQGTALAGNLAILGSIFGAGCGTNTDLTYSGAANWLSTIPSWARAQVDYYTTSFSTKWWRYDYCNIATDLFLNDPEDGTTEQWAGQLSGAANMGHKKGWCHTRNMRDTAQFLDSGRNSSMNSRAAR
jgi:hypothetical protein